MDGLDRAVPNLGHDSPELFVRQRVNGHHRRLSQSDARNVRLVHFYLGLEHREISDGGEYGASVVHRPDDDGLPLFDVSAGDDAGERRRDRYLGQFVAGAVEIGLFLTDALDLRGHLDLPLLELGLS